MLRLVNRNIWLLNRDHVSLNRDHGLLDRDHGWLNWDLFFMKFAVSVGLFFLTMPKDKLPLYLQAL